MFTGAPWGGPSTGLSTEISAPAISRPTLPCMRARVSKLSNRRSWYSVKFTMTRASLAPLVPPMRGLPPAPTVVTADSASSMPSTPRTCRSRSRAMLSRYSTRVPTGAWASTQTCLGGMSSGKNTMPLLKRPKAATMTTSTARDPATMTRRWPRAQPRTPS